MLIAVVALVVFDPRRLPEVLGTAGKWVAKVRRMTTEMRRQTGIDEILREEGISGGISELRSMLRPDLMAAARFGVGGAVLGTNQGSAVNAQGEAVDFDRFREYPTEGPDAYGAIPEDLLDSPPPSPRPPSVIEGAPLSPVGGSAAKEPE